MVGEIQVPFVTEDVEGTPLVPRARQRLERPFERGRQTLIGSVAIGDERVVAHTFLVAVQQQELYRIRPRPVGAQPTQLIEPRYQA